MGLFGSKQQPVDQAYQDQPVQDASPVQAPTPPPSSIDGVLPVQHDSASPVAPAYNDQSVPPVSDQPTEDNGGYIMTDAPVAQNNWDDTSEHQHEETAPEQPTEPEPQLEEPPAPEQSQAPVPVEESAPEETYQDASSVPSTHPLPVDVRLDDNAGSGNDDLSEIRSKALQDLSPLVGHLDQSPEERFHTTMMMMQATDDHTLVKPAYEAAQEITDEKTRAQALLDIVNEINYFTQKKTD